MTREEYDAIEAVNWTTAKEAAKSPLHYRERVEHPLEDTTRLAIGRAGHTAVLEPDRFALDYAVFRGERRAGKAWEEFRGAHPENITILRVDEYEQCLAMRDAVRNHPVAGPIFRRGTAEHVLTWTDATTGLPCKGRIDFLADGPVLVDLKTTKSVSAREFAATAARMLYHAQLAFYRQGLAANGVCAVPTKIVAVEVDAPHDVAVFALDDDTLWAGEEVVREVMTKIAECRRSKSWPGRYATEQPLTLPAWAFPQQSTDDTLASMGLVIQEA